MKNGQGQKYREAAMGESLRQRYAGPWAKQGWSGRISPPGTYSSVLKHPSRRSDEILEVGIVHEHRFAFTFWNQWRTSPPSALVSIDWHQDLQHPSESEQQRLLALDTSDETEVALFAWTQLNPLNDGQILAAAWLGILGDIFVLCKHNKPEEFEFQTRDGCCSVKICHDPSKFVAAVTKTSAVILDIDLDYFTDSPAHDGGPPGLTLTPKAEMKALLDPAGQLISGLAPMLKGVTIALEPEFCGGIRNAHRLFGRLNSLMFGNTLLSEKARWLEKRAIE